MTNSSAPNAYADGGPIAKYHAVGYNLFSVHRGDAISFGADPSGTQDSLSAFNSAITAAASSEGVVTIPPGNYLTSGPILVEYDNIHIDLQAGATISAIDSGSFSTLEIDDTKSGMPQMKTMIAFRDCTGSSISGGGVIDAGNIAFSSAAGESGVFVRNCTEVLVKGITVKNVWPPSFGDTEYGGEGEKRYTGILFIKSTRCAAENNTVYHCKYDGISARMENTDIRIEGNKCYDCFEGVQSSPQYGTVYPEETNIRTKIFNNTCWDFNAQGIVFHSDFVDCSDNTIHSPQSSTQGIRAIGANEADIRNNKVYGVSSSTEGIATLGFRGIVAGVTNPSFFSNNRINWADKGIDLTSNVVFYPTISGNIIWQCNTGIDLAESATTRDRRAQITGNFIRAFRKGIVAQDTGPTIIANNTIQEQAGFTSATIGIDLDPAGNNDVAYILEGSYPTGFDTPINSPARPAAPTSASFGVYYGQTMHNAEDRYINRGELTVTAGNTTGSAITFASIAGGNPTPSGGEIQITQMGGPPMPFAYSASAGGMVLTMETSTSVDCTFGWSMHLSGYYQA